MLTKEEITYLYEQGFSIAEIREMDKPTETLKGNETKPVESGKVTEKTEVKEHEEVKEEKKNLDSSEVESLKNQIKELKELVQANNRDSYEGDTAPKESVEDILAHIIE